MFQQEAQPLTGASYRIKSDDDAVQLAFRWARLVGRQRGVVAIERRAIGAHILNVLAHVAKDMRVVLWWCAPIHMNFLAPISMTGTPGSLWK